MSRSRQAQLAVALVLVAAVGYLVAHATSTGGVHTLRATASAAAPRTATTPSTGTGSVAGWDATRGAVDAAAAYLDLIDDPGAQPGGAAALRALTVAPLTARAERARVATVELSAQLSAAAAGFVHGWRLGWRVVSFTGSLARVGIWTMGTVVSQREVVSPVWSTTVCTLRWSGARWRVSAAQTTAGPTPPGPSASRTAVAEFVRAASSFRAFGDAA